jgi:hypothetical protein
MESDGAAYPDMSLYKNFQIIEELKAGKVEYGYPGVKVSTND